MLKPSISVLAAMLAIVGCGTSDVVSRGTPRPSTVVTDTTPTIIGTTSSAVDPPTVEPTVPAWTEHLDPSDGPLLIVGDGPGDLKRVPPDDCDFGAYVGQEAHVQSWMDDGGRMLTIGTAASSTGELLPNSLPPWTYDLYDDDPARGFLELRTARVEVYIGGDALDGDWLKVAAAIEPRIDGKPGWALPPEWDLVPLADGQTGANCVVVDTVRVVKGLAPLEVRVLSEAPGILAPTDVLSPRSLLPGHDGVLVTRHGSYTEAAWQVGDSGYYANLLAVGDLTDAEVALLVDDVRAISPGELEAIPVWGGDGCATPDCWPTS